VPQRRWQQTVATLGRLCRLHWVELIAVGHGTASRETGKLAAEIVAANPKLKMVKISFSEAGASVYSASEIASRELPGLDVSHRGAFSIARRLQDRLAELVKIDPKSIGVDQYQHDVSEYKLSRSLAAVVKDAVNAGSRREHRVRAAARPRVGAREGGGRQYRVRSRRQRAAPYPRGSQGCGRPTAELARGKFCTRSDDAPESVQ
jgi:uncharacterized protein